MEEKSMKYQSANYVLRDEMEDKVGYDIANPDSPIFAFNALEEFAARQRRREELDSNKRLAWLEDSKGKIVAEATVRATTILDDDFQKAIVDEELAILQGESECNDEEIEEIGSMKP